jgi:uncharacterized membrane protein
MTANRRLVCLLGASAATAWVALLLAAPVLASAAAPAGGWLYAVGALICHQRPERSFHLGAAQLPVCARCLGLYMGAAAGLIAWTFIARRRRTPWMARHAMVAVGVTGAPTFVTVLSAWLGLGDPSNAWRALLAVPLGIAGGLVTGAVTTDHLK